MLEKTDFLKNEELILVDLDDNELGFLNKEKCHDGEGILHRAFSLFVFNSNGDLLLQKRSEKKRLWPLFWSNTCCSHPRKGESMEIATRRRLKEELNIEASLECIYKFSYQAHFGELGSENELCSVYLGRTTQDFFANKDEIADARYVSCQALQNKLQVTPEAFTPWFKMEWKQLCSEFTNKLNAYTRGN